MRTETAAPWTSFPEDEGSGACALYFVENGVSASKPQWETLRHTYISMIMISKKQDLRDEYLGISIDPGSLGFLFISLGIVYSVEHQARELFSM